MSVATAVSGLTEETVAPDEKEAYQRIFQDLHQLNQKNKAEGKPVGSHAQKVPRNAADTRIFSGGR